MTAELLNVDMQTYVADRFAGPPSLSSGLAHLLISRSPLHSWTRHPRLNPTWTPDDDRDFDLGTAVHAVLLENKPLEVIAFPDEKTGEIVIPTDYKRKGAQKARGEAKTNGLFPLLLHQRDAVERMVANARAKIAESPDLVDLGELLAERTIRWSVEAARSLALPAAWLRCRPDLLTSDHAVVLSLKTTRASAEPDAFLRTLIGAGYDMQCAFECAGVRAITGVEPKYVWLVLEAEEPYAASLVGASPALMDYAQQRMLAAVGEWTHCLVTNEWPGYSERIAYVDPPPWAQARWLEQAPEVVDDGRPLADQLAGEATP